MKQRADSEKLMIRYLLGDAPEDEQIRIEERFFTDDEYFEQLLALEDDLIDDYVNGELTDREREQFEEYFLAPPTRRQRVEFAKTFMRAGSLPALAEVAMPGEARPEPVPWWRTVMVFWRAQSLLRRFALAASVVLALGGPWLIVDTVRLRNQVEQLQAEEFQRYVQFARMPAPPRDSLAFALFPGRTRDDIEGTNRFVIPQDVDSVQLRLYLPMPRALLLGAIREPAFRRYPEDRYTDYRAVVRTAKGNEVWSQDGLKAQRTGLREEAIVILDLPTRILPEGDYIITLSRRKTNGDFEDVGSYQFSVVRK